MDAAPFDTELVIARIKSSVNALRQVAGAADYASAKKLGDFATPSAFVLLAHEKGTPTATSNDVPGKQVAVRERVIATFGVVVVVRNFREQAGAQAADSLRSILGGIRGALIGWVPDCPGARHCQFLQGSLTDYDNATLLWTDVYQTQHILGVNAS